MVNPNDQKNLQLRILFLGDPQKQKLLEGATGDAPGSRITATPKREKALQLAEKLQPKLLVVDYDQQGLQPLEFIHQLFETVSQVKVIGITENAPLSMVVNSIKLGVQAVVNTREEPHALKKEIARLIHTVQELDEGEHLHQQQRRKHDFSAIISESDSMQQVFDIMSKIIRRKWVTVFIKGETGTGKELIARAIHYNTFRQFQSFVEINCNALPENLLESELFGYEKGAFTDAKSQKKGLFELAQNGTLFLDEIGDISHTVQVKLLKALEEKKIRRLGGIEDIPINTRIISATNRDMQAAIREGRFRNDLYYRLNVVSIQLPPLRDRDDDVLVLARHFLSHYAREYESPLEDFTPEAEALLCNYDWPGNVRELQHTIERVALLAEGSQVTQQDLSETIDSETPLLMSEKKQSTTLQINIPPDGMSLDDGEKVLIEAVLNNTQWNKRKTSQILKISRPRLDRKIEKYNLEQVP